MAMAIVVHDSDSVLIVATVEITTPALAACIESASPSVFASLHALTNWSLLVALRTVNTRSKHIVGQLTPFRLARQVKQPRGLPATPTISPMALGNPHFHSYLIRFSNIILRNYEAEAGTATRRSPKYNPHMLPESLGSTEDVCTTRPASMGLNGRGCKLSAGVFAKEVARDGRVTRGGFSGNQRPFCTAVEPPTPKWHPAQTTSRIPPRKQVLPQQQQPVQQLAELCLALVTYLAVTLILCVIHLHFHI